MPILAIDTATMVSSAAVATHDRLLSEVTMQLKKPQSEVLMDHIIDALTIAQTGKNDLTAIAVNIGPGSFTGLRIGMAAAKMMAYALKIPIVGIDAGTILAYHFPVENVYSAVFIDAQKENVYFAVYNWQNRQLVTVKPMTVMKLEAALEICRKMDYPVIALGDIAQKKQSLFAERANIHLAPPYLIMPRAANVAFAGLAKLDRNLPDNIMTMEPLYIRRSEAEVLWEKRQKDCNK
ncbi:tRNA (adenosine(37)-N6)-threonylcarbamoyltransferase complex dimerization subunit type 1 TsaB [Pectinatus frisingensis]|uniref:tRNA (adenosine(37)-N6)-threonylcarbamoyltransferase complex dimerization subunit type 1 TsaB n=1 Tax=Pectinatus frisingensis TaxID=865 RepID=UPI0015F575A1|nr:tRNA (adenosine(37)-N6)-threonylcarbamoyltransferase complex dimerization subunit type 1 TsaB [Pectinatus frisingensis]